MRFFLILFFILFYSFQSLALSNQEKNELEIAWRQLWISWNECWFEKNSTMTKYVNNLLKNNEYKGYLKHEVEYWQNMTEAITNRFPKFDYSKCDSPPDLKAEAWAEKNPWFGVNKEMTDYAFLIHSRLVKKGFDTKSDVYYSEIDKAMRKKFPKYFNIKKDRVVYCKNFDGKVYKRKNTCNQLEEISYSEYQKGDQKTPRKTIEPFSKPEF